MLKGIFSYSFEIDLNIILSLAIWFLAIGSHTNEKVYITSEKTSPLYRTWGSEGCGYEDFCVLGYIAVQSVESQLTLRRNMSPIYSGSNSKTSKKASLRLPDSCFKLISCLAYSSTMKIEATCSSEKSIGFKLTTRRYIQKAGLVSP
jgi:hypothetical protein